MRRLCFALTALGTLAGATSLAAGCSSAKPEQETQSSITNIPQTPVTDQGATGSCWLYTTANWVESLHMRANGNSVHYSPAYWLYWEFYDQILSGKRSVRFGGYWGRAVEIIRRYGLVPMGSFAVEDASAQTKALDAINLKLESGILGPEGSTPNAALVRALLDEAFALGNDQRSLLTEVFGADGAKNFSNGATPSGGILSAKDISIKTSRGPGLGLVTSTLDAVLGVAKADARSADDRDGAQAWTAVYPPDVSGIYTMMRLGRSPGDFGALRPPEALLGDDADGGSPADAGETSDAGASDDAGANANPIAGLPVLTAPDPMAWRQFVMRVQRALNDGMPVPMAWTVLFPRQDTNGRFHAASGSPVVTMPSSGGGHEVLLTDYEVTNVPGYGTLSVGVQANADQRAASLDPSAVVTFFRVKNSWGTDTRVTGFQGQAGYSDIDTEYLRQPIDWCLDGKPQTAESCWAIGPQVWDVVLPPGY